MQSSLSNLGLSRRSFVAGVLAGASTIAMWPKFPGAMARDLGADKFDAISMANLVQSGEATSRELVEQAISRLKEVQPVINVLSAERFEAALKEAGKKGTQNGPFAGVPFLMKDLLEYPGMPFQNGSRMFSGHIGDRGSDYVTQIEKAGLVVLGKTTTPEFGLSCTTEPVLTGITRNPWNTEFSPGGSSGGSAAAVAARVVPFAHASDGGGSIRIPASMTGLFGLKPSRGRNVQARKQGLPGDLSVEHCVSLSVRDSARYLAMTERVDESAPLKPINFVSAPASKRLKIKLIISNFYGEDPDTEVANAVRETARLCESLGHTVEEGSWGFSGEELITHFMTVWTSAAAGVAGLYQQMSGKRPDENVLEPWTLKLAEEFSQKPKEAMPQALAYFKKIAGQYDTWFNDIDVMLSPVVKGKGLPIGQMAPDVDYQTLRRDILDFASYTPLHNITGGPAMSVPLNWSSNNLPIGSQFAAAVGEESMLLSLAYELEAAKPWFNKLPPVTA